MRIWGRPQPILRSRAIAGNLIPRGPVPKEPVPKEPVPKEPVPKEPVPKEPGERARESPPTSPSSGSSWSCNPGSSVPSRVSRGCNPEAGSEPAAIDTSAVGPSSVAAAETSAVRVSVVSANSSHGRDTSAPRRSRSLVVDEPFSLMLASLRLILLILASSAALASARGAWPRPMPAALFRPRPLPSIFIPPRDPEPIESPERHQVRVIDHLPAAAFDRSGVDVTPQPSKHVAESGFVPASERRSHGTSTHAGRDLLVRRLGRSSMTRVVDRCRCPVRAELRSGQFGLTRPGRALVAP
jgi:hypothetical protein